MPTECSAERFDFGMVDGRAVEAPFDAELVTSDAGALLLGTTDRAIRMMDRFAACLHDERRADLIEHDHDELRHDPLMAALAGKLAARRAECAPVAGNRRSTGWS